MISEPLKFSPDAEHLRYAREREEYVNRLKAFQVGEESVRPKTEEAVVREEKKHTSSLKTSDLVIIGAILLLLTDGVQPQDTVLLGILIYLLLG